MAGEKPPPLFCTVFNLHGYRGPVVTLFRFSHLIMPVLLSMVYRSESACVISRCYFVSSTRSTSPFCTGRSRPVMLVSDGMIS